MEDHYALLGVSQSATKAQIRSAYLRLIRQYHPDHNPSPAAAEVSQHLNEAYSVLSDNQQRPLYDAWLKSRHQPAHESAESRVPTNQPLPDFKCSKCGKQDASLRLAVMYYAISLLVVTHRRAASGIWCERCRAIEAAKWSAVRIGRLVGYTLGPHLHDTCSCIKCTRAKAAPL
jgi:curved DNA-binding protein CbpA